MRERGIKNYSRRFNIYYTQTSYLCGMKNRIHIPVVNRDERIGSVFNQLFVVINQVETCPEQVVVWDFKDSSFFHPFFLSTLSIYKDSCKEKRIVCENMNGAVARYLKAIHFEKPISVERKDDATEKLSGYNGKSYTPVCSFDTSNRDIDPIQSIIQQVIERQSHADKKITDPLSYLFSELICNICQHSQGNKGYIFSQYYKGYIHICLADDGITVYGSYVKAKKYLDQIDSEAEALKMANEGYSTKDLPSAENRGYGISTSKAMLVNGLGGAFFMLSGNAFHRFDEASGVTYVNLPETIRWNGTVILMKIPVKVRDGFRYMDYIS